MGKDKLLSQLTTGKLVMVAILIAATWLLLKWMRNFFAGLEARNPRLRFLARQVEPPIRILVWFGALLLATDILAPSKDAFLAALGSAALAIGLGSQDLIKNLIGGLVIVADHPYQTGDSVRMGDATGEVVQIGLRSTKVLTHRGVLVTIPNSEVLLRYTYNATQGVPQSLVAADVAVPHGTDPDILYRIGREVAIACPYTHLGHPVMVELDEKGPTNFFMRLTIKAYVYDHRHEVAMQSDLIRRAKREFLALGVVRPFEQKPSSN
jgi:MscS family membrane protein